MHIYLVVNLFHFYGILFFERVTSYHLYMASTMRAYVASILFMVLCEVVNVLNGHTSGHSLFHGVKLVWSERLAQHPVFAPSVMSTSSNGIWGVYPRAGT